MNRMTLSGFEAKNELESYRRRNTSAAMFRLYGARYQEYRRRWNLFRPTPSHGPLHLDIDLRDACNFSCAMCHQAYRKRTNIRINRTLLTRAITEAAGLGLCAVNFGASAEPLLEPELLFHALECVNRVGVMDTFIHTNGILLTDDVSRRLLASGLKHVCVSLDAATAQMYAKIRKNAAFEKIEQNILELIRLRDASGGDFPEVRVSFCVVPENAAEKEAFAEKWTTVADLVEFQRYRHVDGSQAAMENRDDVAVGGWGKIPCFAGNKRAMLWPNGFLAPCCGGWEGIVFGDLHTDSFENIWISDQAKQVRAMLQEATALPPLCAMCLAGRSPKGIAIK